MKYRYDTEIVVRVRAEDGKELEVPYKINVTADCEVNARRAVLKRCWDLGWSLVRFISVHKRVKK